MHEAQFLNVDLDLSSAYGLKDLVDAMKPFVVVLNNEREEFISVELSSVQPTTIDDAIARYARLVKQFAPEHKKLWDQCNTRRMNIGIKSGNASHQSSFCISEESLALLGTLRAEIALTIYAP